MLNTMDIKPCTAELPMDVKKSQENLLLAIVKELCYGSDSIITPKLKEKVNRIISDSDLTHHISLHKLSSADESTSTILGFMHHSSAELTFEEQAELNQAILHKIQTKLPLLTTELNNLKHSTNNSKQNNVSHEGQIKELQESLLSKLTTIQDQENEKVQLMIEWLDHRINEVSKFSESSCELSTMKTKILDLKSKILHLQILQNVFTETNQSVKAYSEIEKDLKESIKETEQRIKEFRAIIDSDY